MTKWMRLVACSGALVLVLAACGSDDKKTDTPPKTDPPTTTTEAKSTLIATAEPTTDLAAGTTVTVKVAGFTAGKTLGINECAQAGEAEVGQADCDIGAIKVLTVGADGTGEGTIAVSKGPIGQNAHLCGTPDVRCFLSVGELIEGESERAEDIDLTFAP